MVLAKLVEGLCGGAHKPGIVVQICKASIGEVEEGGTRVPGHYQLYSKLEASLKYMMYSVSTKSK